jgi:hypothetical protein
MSRGLGLLTLLAHAAGCTDSAQAAHAVAGASTSAGAGPGEAALALGDLLPIALRLDCSALDDAAPPSDLYLSIAEPYLETGTLTARLSGALCADHDVAAAPDAPAAAIRCPPRQLVRSDGYPAPCSDHYVEVALCSPGFEELKIVLQNLGPCSTGEREAPSCDDVRAGTTSGYDYDQVTYELRPLDAGANGCPSFTEPPPNLLADEPLYSCPCSDGGQ